MDLQVVVIIALTCFILGMVLGISLVRPRSTYQRSTRWEE
jgi:hypothetical protein